MFAIFLIVGVAGNTPSGMSYPEVQPTGLQYSVESDCKIDTDVLNDVAKSQLQYFECRAVPEDR